MGMLARRTVSGSLKPFNQSHTLSNLFSLFLQQTTAKSWLYRRVFVAIFEVLIIIPRRQFPLAVDCGKIRYLWPFLSFCSLTLGSQFLVERNFGFLRCSTVILQQFRFLWKFMKLLILYSKGFLVFDSISLFICLLEQMLFLCSL